MTILRIFLIVLLCNFPGVVWGAIIYDLATGWSDTQNPNGVWSYNSAPGVPIQNHVDDWDVGSGNIFGGDLKQPAWSTNPYPSNDHVPMWFKRTTVASLVDVPIGGVGMHGTEAGDTQRWVGVSWTSPGQGAIDIAGAVWQAMKSSDHYGRSMDWRITLDGAVLTSGVVSYFDSYTSLNPMYLYLGSGGAAALTHILVDAGDVLSLEFIKSATSTYSTFAGTQLTISYSAVPIPAAVWLLGAGLIGLVGLRRKAVR